VTQRRFEVAPEEIPSPATSETAESPRGETIEPVPTPPRPPSGDALRARQLRWLAERERFEASETPRRPAAKPPGEATK